MENTVSTEKDNKTTSSKGNISKKYYLWVIGGFTLLGVIGGYTYYALIGCNGSCTIQSSPYLSMIWGGAMGYLLPDMVLKPKADQ